MSSLESEELGSIPEELSDCELDSIPDDDFDDDFDEIPDEDEDDEFIEKAIAGLSSGGFTAWLDKDEPVCLEIREGPLHVSQDSDYKDFVGRRRSSLGLNWDDERELTHQERASVETEIVMVTERGIKLIVLDFDDTFVSIHTSGTWQDDLESLANCVRPLFKDVVRIAMSHGIHIAIATHSPQPEMIRKVLLLALPGKHIVVFGGKKELYKAEGNDLESVKSEQVITPHKGRKKPHLEAAREHFEVDSFGQMLLIDDDPRNVNEFKGLGGTAVMFDVHDPYSLCLRD
eukprot:TRINITY_DN1872_c0_g1_i2.p1 TRINITY_DN1872_c0_g1~~TRINITY_DN1872_c0_g1_i2.p1  ORF type:complete len:288 (-),score=61.30 TRINITY_DN1872_c0_g1_i2:321-1184(-)